MTPSNGEKDGSALRSEQEAQPAAEERLLVADLSGQKRKEPEKVKNRFKIAGTLVMAMRRFQDSINPTYTYGKRASSSSGGVSGSVERRPAAANEATEASSGLARPSSAHTVYQDRGHKTDYLFRPLPGSQEDAGVAAGKTD